MRHRLFDSLTLVLLATLTLSARPAGAQTTANGPYYATPSWDQTLPANTRFIVLSNMGGAAVLDRETGLVWEKSPDTSGDRNWQAAQSFCIERRVGGRGGWKLPSVQELHSLVDQTQSFPALPPGHPFTGVQGGFEYWSATTVASATRVGLDARVMGFFDNGFVDNIPKDNTGFVWCVRGG